MKTLIFLGLTLLFLKQEIKAQWDQVQYFDGADIDPYNSLIIDFEPTINNIWQIGAPQKVIFNSASTFPNVIVTDTLYPYPINNISTFKISIGDGNLNYGVLELQWVQKLDIDNNGDGALIEFSIDNGVTWENPFYSSRVENFYGFNEENSDTIQTDKYVFSGTDTTWKDIWLGIEVFESTVGTVYVKFTFISDDIDNNKEGWMIDNIVSYYNQWHTLNNINLESAITVYPNPTDNIINIQLEHLQQAHFIESMVMTNVQGQTIESWSNLPSKFYIDTKEYNNGVYFLTINSNLYSETKSILVNHN